MKGLKMSCNSIILTSGNMYENSTTIATFNTTGEAVTAYLQVVNYGNLDEAIKALKKVN